MICTVCGTEFETTKGAKTCSSKCRKQLSRVNSVTPAVTPGNVTLDVTLDEPNVTPVFRFYTVTRAHPIAGEKEDKKSEIREAKYWTDVPLGAIPVLEKDWPKMPDYLNGRQYFLWWKNGFKVNDNPDKGTLGGPVMFNPFPEYDTLNYVNRGSCTFYGGKKI
jgi:hypothetical protein